MEGVLGEEVDCGHGCCLAVVLDSCNGSSMAGLVLV